MYLASGQQFKTMIRNLFSICFLVLSTGLPLLAKNAAVDHPTATPSSKAGKAVVLPPRPAPSVAKAKEQNAKKVATVTSDVSRGSVSPAQLAKEQAAAALLAPEFRAPTHLERTASSSVVIRSSGASGPEGVSLHTSLGPVTADGDSSARGSGESRLARVTAYWAGEGDYYTGRGMSATGVRLHDGHCAVDPNIIPYGSVVEIAGVGRYLAVDTGSAVISRTAAREGGHTYEERHAIVVDVYFEDRDAGERFEAAAAKFVSIKWWTPTSTADEAKAARGLFAEEDWTKIQSKQL